MFDDELHPEAFSIIKDIRIAENSGERIPMYNMNHMEARASYLAMRSALSPPAPKILKSINIKIPVENQKISARYYRGVNKDEKELLPLTIFFHGGGWVIGDLDTHDVVCRQLANEGQFDVLAIDYRMGPEHRFPTAINDAINSISWVNKNPLDLPIMNNKIAVCGDSAGGNIAAVCCINSKINAEPKIKFQALIYPSTHLGSNYKSKEKYDGYILSKLLMKWFEEKYINKNKIHTINHFSPFPKSNFEPNLKLESIFYAGNTGRPQNISTFINFFNEQFPQNWKFELYGAGQEFESLSKFSKDNININDYLPREDLEEKVKDIPYGRKLLLVLQKKFDLLQLIDFDLSAFLGQI